MMEVPFYSSSIIMSFLCLAIASSDEVTKRERHKLTKQPIGIKMCKQLCEVFNSCLFYQYNPYSLTCSTGFQSTGVELQMGTLGFNNSKELYCGDDTDVSPEMFLCLLTSVVMTLPHGRCVCIQDRRTEQINTSNTMAPTSSDLNLSTPLERACLCAYDMCGQNNKKQTKVCLTQLCARAESDGENRGVSYVTNMYVGLGKCNLSKTRGIYGTILHTAASFGFVDLVRCVLSKRSLRSIKAQSKSLLMVAVRKNNVATCKVLLKAGARLGDFDQDGKTVLHSACESADIDIITAILDKGVDIERRSKAGLTPIMYAVQRKNLEVFKLLVDKGCNVSVRDARGMTLLHKAAKIGADEIVKYVLSENLVDKDSPNRFGRTPVFTAVLSGQNQAFKVLAGYGCDLKVVDGFGNTLLHAACRSGKQEIVTRLLMMGFRKDLMRENDMRLTPLMLVKKKGGPLDQMLKQMVKKM